MADSSWVPDGIDADRPNPARIYDYFLGGAHNFAADRELAERAIALRPRAAWAAQSNRKFLIRAVRYLRSQGIDQFLDLGSGIPTAGNVHQIAQSQDPTVRVAYVDNESVAVAHSTELLEGNGYASITQADLRDVDGVLGSAGVADLIDFDRPVGLLMVAVLHFIPDDEAPSEIAQNYRSVLSPGSHIVFSHGSHEGLPPEVSEIVKLYQSSTTPVYLRTKAELEGFFAGLPLVEPGMVDAVDWRPDEPETERSGLYAAVAKV